MRRTRVKICGIRRPQDAVLAAELGADAIGMVRCARSPRHAEIAEIEAVRNALPALVSLVVLFVDPEVDEVREVIDRGAPDLLQFHGDEGAAFCQQFARPYLKAVPMGDDGIPHQLLEAHSAATGLVLDSHTRGGLGGSGTAFDWSAFEAVRQALGASADGRLILAGGLGPDNVAEAVRGVRPWAVDVSSGVEDAPGIKSEARMQDFFSEVVRGDSS